MRVILVLLAVTLLVPAARADADFDLIIGANETTVRPQAIATFPIRLVGHASEPVRVRFETSASPGFEAPTPEPIDLTPARPVAELGVMVLTPHANGRVNQTGAVRLRAFSDAGERVVALVVHAEGFYAPGPTLPLVVAAAAAASWRRRD